MLVGRFIFGLGGETQFVCKSAIISNWFRGKELALAFGINLSFSRLGSVLASIVEPHVVDNRDGELGLALWLGFGFCVLSWFCGVGIVCCETYADKVDGAKA
jgi:MFS family permease